VLGLHPSRLALRARGLRRLRNKIKKITPCMNLYYSIRIKIV
jgi:hypothetical protein